MKIEIKNNMRNNIKKNHRQPRYALRKMSVGFTSCVIGWCIFSSSTTVHASVLPDTSISTSTTSINNTTQTSPITENVVDTSTITKPIDSNKLIESTATTIETTSTVETITVALENNTAVEPTNTTLENTTAVEPTNTTVENTTAVEPITTSVENTTAVEPITTSVETISSTDGIATNSTSTSTSQLQPKMLMMISPMSVSPTAPSIYISNMTELLNAINNYSDVNIFIKGTTYLIDKAISIASGKNISFNVDPSSTEPVIFLRDVSKGYLSGSLVTVEQGASITFNSDPGQMIIDGGSTDNPSSGIVSETGLLLTNKGETIINGAEFRNQNLFYGSYIAPIYTSGPGSKLVINSGSIHDNKITANSERIIYSSTAILAENESQVFLNGGEIYNNTIDKSLINSDSVGVINISDGSYFEMNGGQIHHNSARSGVTIGDSRFYAYYIKPETWQTEGTIKNNPTSLLTIDQIFVPGKRMPKIAKAVINNGTINNNMAYANGGGLNVWSASEVTINGGKIENNETNGYGGGISVIDNYLNYLGGIERKIANVKRSEWEQYLGAKLTINNATINGNKSTDGRGYGGGMFIASDLVTINKADISNNMAVNGAGIAMTDKAYTLKLKNVSTDQSIGNSSFSNLSDSNLYIYEKDGLVFTPINPGTGTSNSNYDLTANFATNNILDPAYRMLGGGLINYIDKLGNTVNADPKYSNSVTPTIPAHYIDPIDGYATKSSLDYGKTLASITMNGNYSVYYYRALNRYYPSSSSGSNFFNGGTLIIGTPDNIKNKIDVNATLNFKTIYDSFLAQDPNNILKLTVNYETPMGNVILEEHDIPSLEGLVQIIGNLSETNDLSKLKFQFSGINTDETITLTADNFIKSETISSTERVWNSDTFMFDEKTYYTTLNHFSILLDTVIKSVETITSLPEKIIYDSTKPIGTEIVEPGVDGLTQTNSTILKINGIESDVIMTSQNVIKEPIAQIRIIGTGVVGQNVDVTFEVIPIPTQPTIIEDATIPLGEEVIVDLGSEGQIKVTTTTPTLNGIPNGETIVTREIVTQAKAKVIKRGTGVVGQNVDVTFEVIPIPTQPTIIEDATIPLGEEVIVDLGSEGQIKVTTTTPTLNGIPNGETIVTREIVTQAKAKVIKRGTGVVGQNVDVTFEVIPIPTQPTIIEDATIPLGEEVIVETGSEGQIKVTTTTPTLNGSPNGEPIVTREIVTQAKAKVIKRGTGVVGQNVDVTFEVIPIPTQPTIIEDATIPLGEEVIVDLGSEGQIKVTTTTPTLNGIPNGETIVTREIVSQAKAKVIKRGTGVVGQNVDVTFEVIPIPTQPTIIEDATIPLGEEVIVDLGSEGQIKVTTTTPTLNGIPNGEPIVTREIVTQAKAKVIKRGTGVVGQNVDVTFEVIPIPTQPTIIEDATIPLGEEVIVETGSEGQIKVTTTTPTLNGSPNGEPIVTREIVTQAKAKVIKRGTGVVGQNVDVTFEVIPIPTQPTIIEDATIPLGEEVIVDLGSEGQIKVTTTTPTLNGSPNGEPIVTREIVSQAKAKVIKRGTGVVGQNVDVTFEVIPIPTQPTIIEDATIPLGEEVIVETGSEGQIKVTTTTPTLNGSPNGEPIVTREIVTQAKAKVIKRGTGISSSNIDTIKARITKAISDKKHEVNANETIILPNTGFKHNHKQTYGLLSILLSLILFVFKYKRRTK